MVWSAARAAMLLGGCSGGAESQTEGSSQAGSTAATQAEGTAASGETSGESAEEFSYPMAEGETLTWWKELNNNVALEFTTMSDTPFAQGLMERTGIQIEFQHPPAACSRPLRALQISEGPEPPCDPGVAEFHQKTPAPRTDW